MGLWPWGLSPNVDASYKNVRQTLNHFSLGEWVLIYLPFIWLSHPKHICVCHLFIAADMLSGFNLHLFAKKSSSRSACWCTWFLWCSDVQSLFCYYLGWIQYILGASKVTLWMLNLFMTIWYFLVWNGCYKFIATSLFR